MISVDAAVLITDAMLQSVNAPRIDALLEPWREAFKRG
jgi:hypothetical protein